MFDFNFVLPNLVWAKLAVVNINGACERDKNEFTLTLPLVLLVFVENPGEPFTFLFMYVAELAGLGAEVGGEFCGDVLGLNDNAAIVELTTSIGRKH